MIEPIYIEEEEKEYSAEVKWEVERFKKLSFKFKVPYGKTFDVGTFSFKRLYAPYDCEAWSITEDYFLIGRYNNNDFGAFLYKEKLNLINIDGETMFEVIYNIDVNKLKFIEKKEIKKADFSFENLKKIAEKHILEIINEYIV